MFKAHELNIFPKVFSNKKKKPLKHNGQEFGPNGLRRSEEAKNN
jgi:hypothetical protein